MFGKYGYIIFITALFLYLYSIKKFGKPYLYPLCPFDSKEALNIIKRPYDKGRKNL